MTGLPREAREEVMRAWLDILRQRHPGFTWIAADEEETPEENEAQAHTEPELVSTS
jgi:hypothetical protein